MALVTYRSSQARDAVVRELSQALEAENWRTETLHSSQCTAEEFVKRIAESEADALFVLDPDRILFGEHGEQATAWVNFHRERLVEHRGVQMRWMPSDAAFRFGPELPDLNRFFLEREDLTEEIEGESLGSRELKGSDEPVVGDEARGKDYLERVLRAAATGADVSRVWLELGLPAIEAFLDSGRVEQASDAFNRLQAVVGDPEAALSRAEAPAHELGKAFRILGEFREGMAHRTLDPSKAAVQAISDFGRALDLLNSEQSPEEWATAQRGLGMAYIALRTGDRGENAQRAIECFKAALRVHTEQQAPYGWALMQLGLGISYAALPAGDRTANLRRAIECYEAALRVWTELDHPANWASVQNNLGTAYSNLRTGDRGQNLRRAIECYEAALRVRTERTFPQEWAMVQSNLGTAYAQLPSGDRADNLSRAIQCYEAALRVHSERGLPGDWAETQNSLGIAYALMPAGNRAANLRRAIECFQSALRVYRTDTFPTDHAVITRNLQLAREELEKLSQQPAPAQSS